MICTFFDIQENQRKVYAITSDKSTEKPRLVDPEAQTLYIKHREYIIEGVFKIGDRFQQRKETVHIAVELIDQYYLAHSQRMTMEKFKGTLLLPKEIILHQVTSVMIASKYDEIDDNITTIHDLTSYFKEWISYNGNKRDYAYIPNYDQIVACEKRILLYFEWDLKFLLPIHFLRLFLANGVLFSKEMYPESQKYKNKERFHKEKLLKARNISDESLQIADMLLKEGRICIRREQASNIAAAIVYLARKNILEADSPYKGRPIVPQVWPEEMLLMTRCTEE